MKTSSQLKNEWKNDSRWKDITRDYTPEDVIKLRGSYEIKYSIAEMGAKKLWAYIQTEDFVNSLGAVTGNQAIQQVKAGLKAIYLSGWQTAADQNLAGEMYPDQSLYPANSVPNAVRKINNSLKRCDQIEVQETGMSKTDWLAPIVADAEAGFGGALNAFELMKAMIEAGASGVHYEDQLASEKKCGHLGGKVLVPTSQFIKSLCAARLAADVLDVPTVLVARTDAESAKLLTSDIDERDRKFILSNDRTPEGFFRVKDGTDSAIDRAISYGPYADLLWCETGKPDLLQAKKFAEGVRKVHPNKIFAYNCSPSFNWKRNLDAQTIAKFQRELGAMGYKFQFVTLAGFHSLNQGMFNLAIDYRERGMTAYSKLQELEFSMEEIGYTATKHQREVGTGYFDAVSSVIGQGKSSTLAYKESTEAKQFF